VRHAATRFSGAESSQAHEQLGDGLHALDAAAGADVIAQLAAAVNGGGDCKGRQADVLRGYSLVRTPASVAAGGLSASVASPMITWGQVLGTPAALNEAEFGSVARLGQPFKVPQLPTRDVRLHKMANDAGKRHRARTPSSARLPGGVVSTGGGAGAASSKAAASRAGGGSAESAVAAAGACPLCPSSLVLSEAGMRMARSLTRLTGSAAAADSALRQSYVQPTPRATPKPSPRATPRATATPSGGAAAVRPSPLLLRQPAATSGAGTTSTALSEGVTGVTDNLLMFHSFRGK